MSTSHLSLLSRSQELPSRVLQSSEEEDPALSEEAARGDHVEQVRQLQAKVQAQADALLEAQGAIEGFQEEAARALEAPAEAQLGSRVESAFLDVQRAVSKVSEAAKPKRSLREALDLQKRAEQAEERLALLSDRFFYSEALCIKLNALLMGDTVNLDLQALKDRARREKVDPLHYSEWLQSRMIKEG